MGLRLQHRVTLLFLLTVSALYSIGCGSGSYNAKMESRTKQLKRQAPFAELNAPTEIPNTSVKIAIPKILSQFLTLDTEDASSPTGKISADRVKLSMLKIPGSYCAYDAEGDLANGTKATMACQIAVIANTAPEAAALPALITAGLGAAFPGKAVAFEATEVDTPEDTKLPWKMLHVDADLLFDVKESGASQLKKLPAVVEVWWHEGKHYQTLLIWRAPKDVEEKVKLMDLARISAGTLTEAAPPAPAEPAKGE
jgi:hypothetical protein